MDDKIDILDYKYMEQNPEGDADFSAERNAEVVANVIKKTDKMRRQKAREYQTALRERNEATAQFLKALEGGASTDAEKYFGRRELARLRGEEVLNKLKNATEQKGN
jgi:seryl-tRNA synthetase